jgi:hypothetical protein
MAAAAAAAAAGAAAHARRSSTAVALATETLSGAADPRFAASLSVLCAELARAQSDGDQEAVRYAIRAIQEITAGVPGGAIDEPLISRRRSAVRKRRR